MAFLPEDEEKQNKFLGFYNSEPEYRADKEAHNYSKLKDFVKDPLLVWRKKHLLGEDNKKSTPEMDYGSLVDCMMFEPHLKDDRFGISSAPTPTDGPLKFVDRLIELMQEEAGMNREMTDDIFKALTKGAYDRAGIKSPGYERFITEKFKGTDVEVYFAEKLSNSGKLTMGAEFFEAAERVEKMLNNSESTAEIFKFKGEHTVANAEGEVLAHVEGIPQLALKALIEGYMVRVMVDWTVIDHLNKTISPYDMKTTAMGVEDFRWTFFKMKYFIQQGLYEAVVAEWAAEHYPGYTVQPFQFIVVDSSGFVEPLVYEIKAPQGQSFLRTFTLGDRSYVSGLDIIENIEYHIQNNLWTISRANKLAGGRIKISL